MEQQSKEWQLLEKVALESFKEQKRARRWGIFFKLLTFAYIFGAFALFSSSNQKFSSEISAKTEDHTALVNIKGVIMDEESASADNMLRGIRAAFENKHSKAVLLAINSPGGSPVQAGYVYDEIVRLRAKYPEKKIYSVVSDLCASGAYYIAASTDQIYADKASLVGSIGVISSGFGFNGTMEKLGIDRRVIAAGSNKAFLDPFQPQKEEERLFWESSLAVIHEQFKNAVKTGRGDRLKEDEKTFSGFIWSGDKALEMGLIDGLGSADFVAREVIKFEKIVDYSEKASPFDEFAAKFGASIGSAFGSSMAASIAKELSLQSSAPHIN